MKKQRLFVDMDGTLAIFKTVDTLETLYERGYFFNLEPHRNVVEAIRGLIKDARKENIEVFILSSYLSDSNHALLEKDMWLDKYVPELDMEHKIFVPCGISKKDAVDIRPDDFLLDDYTANLLDWEPPARGIKLVNSINDTHKTWQGGRVWYDEDPDQIAGDILFLMKDKKYGEGEKRESIIERIKNIESKTDSTVAAMLHKNKKM